VIGMAAVKFSRLCGTSVLFPNKNDREGGTIFALW
jgi:hypothetical protein